MKTKYNKISLAVLIIIGMLTSCKKDFLDKNPTAAISSETFWKSDADAQMGLTGVYRRLQAGFYGARKLWLDTYSDNALDRHSFFGFGNLTQGIVNPTNIPGAFYDTPYAGIASCNFFLDNIDKAPSSEAAKNGYKAEARFLRAMFYFDLVQAYGGVVLYKTAPKTVDEGKIAKSTKEDVLTFIHQELDFAIANLPDGAYSGHAVKGSAQALKARVYLFQQNWAQAAKFSNDVITGGKFQLYQGGYDKLFLTATQINNPEIIFSTKYLAPNNPQDGEGVLVELGWYGSIAPYQNLIDEYEMSNGKMIGEAGSGYNAADPYSNRDPRLKFTVKVPTEKYINPDGSVFNESDPLLTTYSQKKYVDLSKLPFDRTKTPLTDQNIIHIRYADVLLMYAEAKNEESGPDASVYKALNDIRDRASVKMPAVDQTVYNTKDKLRDFILHERRIELALEGHRYFDLKRRNLMDAKLSPLKNPAGVPLKFGEKNNVLPFSQAEVDRNKQLVQNTGY
ncbi:RagB/SusD family nutrient uptake outer membrane protein [Pedobacter sp. HDW13]|uniref:RagB/SusD family nutrient uptake outer membrane protein n=1 Tax=Pedobacter sp. HDW13 TaxID=2714940 RepID=UPI00140CA481|nr:RagB/SusD family nutrient uptake outer membrane protein [Pedobacter sp. HDW13]QIL40393.1 RagB/SusD family nutrient uptake outer membrane protein [Pedobacter sp. HDW13]